MSLASKGSHQLLPSTKKKKIFLGIHLNESCDTHHFLPLFFKTCTGRSPAHTCVCTVCMQYSQRSEEGIRVPGTIFTNGVSCYMGAIKTHTKTEVGTRSEMARFVDLWG